MPYNLPSLAIKDKPFRVIKPNATQEGELLRLYTPILQRWNQSAAAMMALYAAQDRDGIQAEDDNTDKEIAALLAFIRFQYFFGKVETWHRSKWLASVSAATGVDAAWMVTPPMMIAVGAGGRTTVSQSGGVVAAARQASLTTNQDETITKAIQDAVASSLANARSLSDEARARIQNAVIGGLRSGAKPDAVARTINKGLALGRARASRIAENELDNAVKAMTRARMAEAGLDWGKWQHNTLRNFRPEHKARNNQLYKISDPVWASQYEPNCRCQTVPVLKLGKFGGV